jgi:transcriptional regulator with XRE-family HTH domain
MENKIGNRIRKIREIKGYTQEYMSAKMEISQRTYSKIENNDIKLDWDRIQSISKILEVDPLQLVSFDETLIFENCTQSGKFEVFNNNHFPSELKAVYEQRIEELKQEVCFLRQIIENKK